MPRIFLIRINGLYRLTANGEVRYYEKLNGAIERIKEVWGR
jgi:hypothetical protein